MAYTTLIKPCGGLCNYKCSHCFYKPISRSDTMMTHASVDTLLHRLAEADNCDVLNIVFQGGEPLLAGVEYYQYFTTRAAELMPNTHINYSLQTNGSLIDDRYIKLFRDYKFLIGLSLDGDKSINNRYRFTSCGGTTYDEITAAARLMDKGGVEYNILTVITKQVATNPMRTLKHHLARGYKYLQFTMPIAYDNNTDFLPSSVEMYRFLTDCLGEYASRLFTPNAISIRYYDNLLQLLASGRAEQCGLCGVCSPYLVIDSLLDCYPCDFYATEQHLLGNLNRDSIAELLGGVAFHSFSNSGKLPPTECIGCDYINLCGGGCKRYRGLSADVYNNKNYYCAAYKEFFRINLPKLKSLACKLADIQHGNH